MNENYDWYVKVRYDNGRTEKGIMVSSHRDSTELIKSTFEKGIVPFTMVTLGKQGMILVNTSKVCSITFYNNNEFAS